MWAAWGRGHNIDYPSMSPMFGERALKSPLYDHGEAPPEVTLCDRAVCALDPQNRRIIILKFQSKASYRAMAEAIGIHLKDVRERLDGAIGEVHYQIQSYVTVPT